MPALKSSIWWRIDSCHRKKSHQYPQCGREIVLLLPSTIIGIFKEGGKFAPAIQNEHQGFQYTDMGSI
jgi:hypothetical protein